MDPNEEFRTPMLTPLSSATTMPKENEEFQNSLFQLEYEANMLNFLREIQQNDQENLDAMNNDEERSESDPQDQQATEAAEDEKLSVDPVDTKINESLHSTHCPTDVRSSIEEIQSTDENLDVFISDVTNLSTEKDSISSPLMGRASFCVPYTDDDKKTNENMETLIIDYSEVKKNKGHLGHIMISYNHSTKALCTKIAHSLRSLDYVVWIDEDNISGNVFTSMASAVENAFVVLMAVNQQYFDSRYCRLEAEYATEMNKATIPMLMQAGYSPAGWLGLIKGAKLHVDFVKLSFDQAFNLLIREIETVQLELGGDKNTRSSNSIVPERQTTIDFLSFHSFPNVHQWSNDDVIEWLHRERLEIFQNALSQFNGGTLHQLYKIRLESPTFYHQTIESLLDPNVPSRLFYNLTLNLALESLFSSSSSSSSPMCSLQTKY